MPTLDYVHTTNGVLSDVTSVVLSDPLGSYGVRRKDTGTVVVPAGAVFIRDSVGTYHYTFTEPAPNLSYDYSIQWVNGGETKWQNNTLNTASSLSGVISPAPLAYVQMGIDTVACGDTTLAAYLQTQSDIPWAMQVRKGVTLDLWYNYYVLALLTLAMDYVRMLIDTETGAGGMSMTALSNGVSTSDSNANSQRARLANSLQVGNGTLSSTRSADRESSSQMNAQSQMDGSDSMTGYDHSTQVQTSRNQRDGSNSQTTTNDPSVSGSTKGAGSYFRVGHSVTASNLTVSENLERYSNSLPVVGNFSGQFGNLDGVSGVQSVPPYAFVGSGLAKRSDPNISKSTIDDGGGPPGPARTHDHSTNTMTREHLVAGQGTGSDVVQSHTVGSRTQNVHREAHSIMNGTAQQTASSSMTSTAHAEQHRHTEMVGTSNADGNGSSDASSISHRATTGSSQLVSTNTLDREYYSQIFESLKVMYENTLNEIKQLEQQVLQASRYAVKKMTVRTAQAGLVAASRGLPIRESPLWGLGTWRRG